MKGNTENIDIKTCQKNEKINILKVNKETKIMKKKEKKIYQKKMRLIKKKKKNIITNS